MFNFLFEQKIKDVIQRVYRPRKQFREKMRTLYLAAWDTHYSSSATVAEKFSPSTFRYFSRGFVTALTLVALTGGITSYADYANVGSASPLYTLKRTSESIRLSFTKESARPTLHLEFANRRLQELKETGTEKARLEELVKDFAQELKQSMITAKVVSSENAAEPMGAPAFQSAPLSFSSSSKIEDEESDKEGGSRRNRERKDREESEDRSSDDRFCEQLKEMADDPNPAIRAVTEEDPIFSDLLEKRCETPIFFISPSHGNAEVSGSARVRVATTSTP
ncbi:MAG: DUF5667 domain-containing protein [Patescibacteria group bacterium]